MTYEELGSLLIGGLLLLVAGMMAFIAWLERNDGLN